MSRPQIKSTKLVTALIHVLTWLACAACTLPPTVKYANCLARGRTLAMQQLRFRTPDESPCTHSLLLEAARFRAFVEAAERLGNAGSLPTSHRMFRTVPKKTRCTIYLSGQCLAQMNRELGLGCCCFHNIQQGNGKTKSGF